MPKLIEAMRCAALILVCMLGCACGGSHERTAPRNLLLISLDTLRPDHLGAYGSHRPEVSQTLDRLAARGTRFSQAISQAPWTTPSHMSLITSQYPTTHGVSQGWFSFMSFGEAESTYRTLPDAAVTLADALREQGFVTMAMTGGGAIAGELGFAQGFDVFEESTEALEQRDRLMEWLDAWEARAGERHFVFLHSFEVHAPYKRLHYAAPMLEQDSLGKIEGLIENGSEDEVADRLPQLLIDDGLFRRDVITAMYDGGVRHADDRLGWLLDELERRGLADDTLIVVTSDHGEEFGEHDPVRLWDAHCSTVYDELIRVPLIVANAGRAYPEGHVVEGQVELIDVAPTVLELLGSSTPAAFHGRSLEPLMRGEEPQRERWTFSEATCTEPEMKSLRGERYKYVAAFAAPDEEHSAIPGDLLWEKVFDLDSDPLEQQALEDPALLAQLRALLEERVNEAASFQEFKPEASRIKPGTIDRLRSLGYVE